MTPQHDLKRHFGGMSDEGGPMVSSDEINVYLWGIVFDEAQDGDPEQEARAECQAAFGTDENCLVIDVGGTVLLNTTALRIGKFYAS